MNSMSGINNDPTKPAIVLFGLICAHSFSLPKNERARLRSMTPKGFAKAFYEANK